MISTTLNYWRWRVIRGNLLLQKQTKNSNWLAKVKTNRTLYQNEENEWQYEKPDNNEYEITKRNTTLYIKENCDCEINNNCKYVASVRKGYAVVGFYTLSDAIDWSSFDILDYTNKCRELYLKEKSEVRDE